MFLFRMNYKYRFDTGQLTKCIVLFCAVIIGVFSSIVSFPTLILNILFLCLGFITLLVFSRTAFALRHALILLIISVTIHNGRLGIPFKPDSIALPIIVFVLLNQARHQLFRIQSYPILIPICGFLLVNFISSFINSPVQEISVRQSGILIGRAITFFCIVVATDNLPDINERIPLLLYIILVSQTIISLIGIIIYPYIPNPFVMIGQAGGMSRSANGFFLEANLFGIFALSVVSLNLPILILSDLKHKSKLYWFLFFGIIGIIISYTRSTWLAFLLVLGLVYFLLDSSVSKVVKKRYINLVILFAVIAFLCFLLILIVDLVGVSFGIVDRVMTIFDQKSVSVIHRVNVWDLAITQWKQSMLFGWGLLSFIVIIPGSNGWLYGSIIQTLHDTGIIGLIFMLIICGYGINYSWRGYSIAKDPLNQSIALGYLLAQLSMFFASQFSSFFWGGYYWVLLGVAVGHSKYVIQKYTNQ